MFMINEFTFEKQSRKFKVYFSINLVLNEFEFHLTRVREKLFEKKRFKTFFFLNDFSCLIFNFVEQNFIFYMLLFFINFHI